METNYDGAVGAGIGIAMMMFMFVLGLAFHLFLGYCFKKMAEKTGNEESAGLWWIPLINWLIPLRIAEKPTWWLILLIVPFANLIVLFIVWTAVAEKLGHESWWGIIAVVFGIVGIPYLAFAEGKNSSLEPV